MRSETESALLWIMGIYLVSKYVLDELDQTLTPANVVKRATARAKQAIKATAKEAKQAVRDLPSKQLKGMQQQGGRLYDVTHKDAGHVKDLPGQQLTRQAVLDVATRAGFPDPKLAAAIAMAESGGVPNALNRTSREYSVGLWQINTLVHRQFTPDDMRDTRKNALAALLISKGGSDWRPWKMFTNGKYRQQQTGVLAP